MNDQKSLSILKRFLNNFSLTQIAKEENLSVVRVFQIIKRQAELLIPQNERVKYCTPQGLRLYFKDKLIEEIELKFSADN